MQYLVKVFDMLHAWQSLDFNSITTPHGRIENGIILSIPMGSYFPFHIKYYTNMSACYLPGNLTGITWTCKLAESTV